MMGLPTIGYKDDRIRKEWESGNVLIKLVKIVEFLLRYISIECPEYKQLVLTCVLRFQEEQDHIYLNHTDKSIREKYKKKPWPSVHQYWRGVDIRTLDMPKDLPYKIVKVLNLITYDKNRPNKETAIYHNVGTGSHIHIQVWIN